MMQCWHAQLTAGEWLQEELQEETAQLLLSASGVQLIKGISQRTFHSVPAEGAAGQWSHPAG